MAAAALSTGLDLRRRLVAVLLALVLAAAGAVAIDVGRAQPAASYPLGPGYWMFARDGGVFSFGEAQFYGSTGNIKLNKPVVSGAAVPFLEGYWLVAQDGGVFSFGAAGFYGSTGDITLNQPVVGMAPHPNAHGYWLVARDGGIFSFGSARFYGSTGNIRLNQPIVGMAATSTGNGYWLVARDGGIFAFGDANFFGSMGGKPLNQPIVGMAATPDGIGYYLVAADGGIFAFGDAVFRGSTGNIRLNEPVVAMALRPRFALKVDAFQDGAGESSEWRNNGGDWQLVLTDDAADGVPAGARVFGVTGLDAEQLNQLAFTVDAGTCTGMTTRFNLYLDVNGDGAFDTTRTYWCTGGPGRYTFDPLNPPGGQPPVPKNAIVTDLDIIHAAASTVALDDITAAGLTVPDTEVVRADETPDES